MKKNFIFFALILFATQTNVEATKLNHLSENILKKKNNVQTKEVNKREYIQAAAQAMAKIDKLLHRVVTDDFILTRKDFEKKIIQIYTAIDIVTKCTKWKNFEDYIKEMKSLEVLYINYFKKTNKNKPSEESFLYNLSLASTQILGYILPASIADDIKKTEIDMDCASKNALDAELQDLQKKESDQPINASTMISRALNKSEKLVKNILPILRENIELSELQSQRTKDLFQLAYLFGVLNEYDCTRTSYSIKKSTRNLKKYLFSDAIQEDTKKEAQEESFLPIQNNSSQDGEPSFYFEEKKE